MTDDKKYRPIALFTITRRIFETEIPQIRECLLLINDQVCDVHFNKTPKLPITRKSQSDTRCYEMYFVL